MSKKPLVLLDTATKGLASTVTYNGITVVNDQATTTLSRAVKLNAWSVNGTNTLSAELSDLPASAAVQRSNSAAGSAPGANSKLFSLKLRSAFLGADTSGDRDLANYQWNQSTALTPAAKREVFSTLINLVDIPQWTWVSAASVEQRTQEHNQAIAQLLMQLHQALTDRAIEKVVALQQVQITEQALAFGASPEQALQGYQAFLSERMSGSNWRVEPVQWNQLKINSMAKGRVHAVSDVQNGPPIRTRSGDSMFAIEPYVALVAQRWAIVR
jgi:hypothetical protein